MRVRVGFVAAVAAVCLAGPALVATPVTAKRAEAWVDEAALPFTALPGATAMWGVANGAGYRIEVPDDWNGDLVLYAHGYRGDDPRLYVSDPSIRSYLIDNGYAWAASSYRSNGYVPGQGAKDTHALIGTFRRLVANPDQIFITGHSMGGHVTGVAIEQWPKTFDGAVPMCGVMGDSELFDYFLDTYLLAEYFRDGSVAVPTPDDYFTSGEAFATFAALGYFTRNLTEAGVAYKDALEQLTGGERPTYDEGFYGTYGAFFPFAFETAGTDDGRENMTTEYQLDGDPALDEVEAMLNDLIPRIAAEPQFRGNRGLGGPPGSTNDSPYIAGKFRIPVVSLHTLGELFVPFHMEQIYAERAAANGSADWLVVRAIRDITHCGFTVAEQEAAFADMIAWVETGVKPAGDAILDPVAVADPQFGCEFTLVDRPGLPACED